MTTIRIDLPDAMARAARDAGLLTPQALERLLADALLALARSARAACIVSGDDDLLSLQRFEDIPILTPAQALQQLGLRQQ